MVEISKNVAFEPITQMLDGCFQANPKALQTWGKIFASAERMTERADHKAQKLIADSLAAKAFPWYADKLAGREMKNQGRIETSPVILQNLERMTVVDWSTCIGLAMSAGEDVVRRTRIMAVFACNR